MVTKKVWEKSPQKLVDAFYAVMEAFPEAELRKMFGYPCAFLNGNMFVGLHESNLALRLPVEEREKALANQSGAVFAPMKGRVMRQYIALSEEYIYNSSELKKWVAKSFEHVKTLPPKVP